MISHIDERFIGGPLDRQVRPMVMAIVAGSGRWLVEYEREFTAIGDIFRHGHSRRELHEYQVKRCLARRSDGALLGVEMVHVGMCER